MGPATPSSPRTVQTTDSNALLTWPHALTTPLSDGQGQRGTMCCGRAESACEADRLYTRSDSADGKQLVLLARQRSILRSRKHRGGGAGQFTISCGPAGRGFRRRRSMRGLRCGTSGRLAFQQAWPYYLRVDSARPGSSQLKHLRRPKSSHAQLLRCPCFCMGRRCHLLRDSRAWLPFGLRKCFSWLVPVLAESTRREYGQGR